MKVRVPKDFGGGGRENMMNKINALQNEMAEKQEELANKEYSAASGGGAVSVTVNGKNKLLKLDIKPDVIDPEDSEMLSDLIVAAVNEANDLAKKDYDDTMSALTAGLNIPGLGGLM